MPEAIGSTRESWLAMRRRYQRGSLERDRDRWIARWREDVELPSGEVKRIRRKEILASIEECPTQRMAQKKLEDRLRQTVNRDDYRPTSTITFAQFAAKWQKEIMIHHKPSTQSSEKSVISAQLTPFFGHFELRSINLEMIQRFVNTSEKAPKTIKNAVSVLMVMWDMAKAWGYAQHNPFPRGTNGRLLLKLPTVVKGNTYNFTVEESLAIIDKAQGRWKVFFRILAETGMRPGELAGLRACDVGPRTLRIAQSVWQQRVQTPKTQKAVRTFAISASLAEAVREVVHDRFPLRNSGGNDIRDSRASVGKSDSEDLLFTTETGRPLSMDNFRHRVLGPILEELGINPTGRCGLYAFRHMNATLMDGLNTPMKTRQKRLGHANIETTLTHYTHQIDADDLAAADALGAMFKPTNAETLQ